MELAKYCTVHVVHDVRKTIPFILQPLVQTVEFLTRIALSARRISKSMAQIS